MKPWSLKARTLSLKILEKRSHKHDPGSLYREWGEFVRGTGKPGT